MEAARIKSDCFAGVGCPPENDMSYKLDKRNYRKHSDRNKMVIRKSLQELGAGRSIVVDSEGEIIAGNGVYEQAQKLGLPVREIETDGSGLVVVKRTDLATGDEKRKQLALADNAASDLSDWDEELMREDWSKDILEEWGVKLPDEKETAELSKLEFAGMYYEPTESPAIRLQDCFDTTKYDAKMAAIEQMDLPQETKDLLRFFAYRFIKIDFESVANYYAFCASDEERKAIERLRMVLVDGGINGFIEDDLIRVHEIVLEEEDENE